MSYWLAETAHMHPDAIALIAADQSWTYRELDAVVDDFARRLHAVGVQTGEHVAVLLHNQPDYVCLIHALSRIGAVMVTLNARLTAAEIAWQVEKARCQRLICSSATQAQIAGLSGRLPIYAFDDAAPPAQNLRALTLSAAFDSAMSFNLDAVQSIVFTSGTTGQPKGAMLTHANQLASARASDARLGSLQPGDRWLLTLPLYHVGGQAILWRCCLDGAAVVLHNHFAAQALNDTLERARITHVSLVPTMLKRLLDVRGNAPPPGLRLMLLGGAAASPELLRRAFDLAYPVAPTYGLTEACSQVATMLPGNARAKLGSVGKPLPGTSIRIVDAQGHSLPPNAYGEIVVKGKTVMAGYFDAPDSKTLRASELYTGDIGYLDDDGDLWLIQRRSDLIVSGGENVYPAEVEAVLCTFPGVAEVSVFGIPDAEWGQVVAAALVPENGAIVDSAALLAHARAHLAGYKIPRVIRLVEELPHTASGKIQRHRLREIIEG